MQKVYLLWLMPVCFGIIMLAAYFCHSCCSHEEYNCSMIKVDWLDACTALKVVGSPTRRVRESAFECLKENLASRRLPDSPSRGVAMVQFYEL
jgi:hypothetical protein